jgi:hypothetical protein
MALLALIGIFGSIQVGIGWGEKRPRAGFCPFYVSLIGLFYCIINVMAVLAVPETGKHSRNGASSGRRCRSCCPLWSMSDCCRKRFSQPNLLFPAKYLAGAADLFMRNL